MGFHIVFTLQIPKSDPETDLVPLSLQALTPLFHYSCPPTFLSSHDLVVAGLATGLFICRVLGLVGVASAINRRILILNP